MCVHCIVIITITSVCTVNNLILGPTLFSMKGLQQDNSRIMWHEIRGSVV